MTDHSSNQDEDQKNDIPNHELPLNQENEEEPNQLHHHVEEENQPLPVSKIPEITAAQLGTLRSLRKGAHFPTGLSDYKDCENYKLTKDEKLILYIWKEYKYRYSQSTEMMKFIKKCKRLGVNPYYSASIYIGNAQRVIKYLNVKISSIQSKDNLIDFVNEFRKIKGYMDYDVPKIMSDLLGLRITIVERCPGGSTVVNKATPCRKVYNTWNVVNKQDNEIAILFDFKSRSYPLITTDEGTVKLNTIVNEEKIKGELQPLEYISRHQLINPILEFAAFTFGGIREVKIPILKGNEFLTKTLDFSSNQVASQIKSIMFYLDIKVGQYCTKCSSSGNFPIIRMCESKSSCEYCLNCFKTAKINLQTCQCSLNDPLIPRVAAFLMIYTLSSSMDLKHEVEEDVLTIMELFKTK